MKTEAPIVAVVKRSGIKIEIRKYAAWRFGFDWKPTKNERRRVRCRSQRAAEKKAGELIGATNAGRLDVQSLTQAEVIEFLHWRSTVQKRTTVPDLVKSYLASKGSKELSAGHIESLSDLEKFADAFPVFVHTLDGLAVERWLNSKRFAPRTFNHKLGRIKSLIRFARRNGYVSAALTSVENIDKRKVLHKRECYTPEEIKRMLAVCREQDLPFVVLGAFAGMRPEEIRSDPVDQKPSIRWENFLWTRDKIDVPPDVAKDGRRRFIPINEAVRAFLYEFRNKEGDCVPKRNPDNVRIQIQKSGVKWIHDGLRHSYASFRLALTNDCPALAEEMGNSVAVIREHYLDRKHEDEATAYFAIRPENLAPDGTK